MLRERTASPSCLGTIRQAGACFARRAGPQAAAPAPLAAAGCRSQVRRPFAGAGGRGTHWQAPHPCSISPAGAPQRGVPSGGKLPGPMQPRARGKPIPYRAAFSGQAGAGRGTRARLVDHGLQRAALRRAAQRVQRRGLRLQAAQAAQPGPESRRAACRARDAVQQRHLRARVSAPHPRHLIRHHQEVNLGLGFKHNPKLA